MHACPLSCKRLPVDTQTAGAAEQHLPAIELVDEMVGGGMRGGDGGHHPKSTSNCPVNHPADFQVTDTKLNIQNSPANLPAKV